MASSWFQQTQFIPPDTIFALTAQYVADHDPRKVNLGQGTYRDGAGQPWVLPAVNKAREALLTTGLNHEYLPILGLGGFRDATAQIVLGSELVRARKDQIATCQSLSGTGALHLAGLLMRACRSELPKLYIPSPTWSNHHQVFRSLGFPCESFRYYDPETKEIDLDSYYEMLQSAEPNSVVILHACAHNPTGCDPSKEQWREIARRMKERRLFPLFDAAYLGFNSGSLDEDAFAIRLFTGEMDMEVAVCVSFAKNMGLYGERTGCFLVTTHTEETATNTQSMLEMLQRAEVSNPPGFGAKIASQVLGSEELRQMWYADLVTMSGRIRAMRMTLYEHLVSFGAPGSWDHLIRQSGMFGFLGLSAEAVVQLREKYHIYMADNSRISIAGLNDNNVEFVARSIAQCLSDDQGQ
ncbi:aminotransferase [Penicillium capsulatum]|uniref:Aminotransferase n=1 Tax=Penicillium capsulatum TaxID=69766 RepID=A0A9W9HVE2_9EURO|nr:aminotransferase [Penicillium capsulatum]KAJ6107074.1 Aspartate [Penicillium capsulatum]